jgi:hypothetical protein
MGVELHFTPCNSVVKFHSYNSVENFDNHEIKVDSFKHHPSKSNQVKEVNHGGDERTNTLSQVEIK